MQRTGILQRKEISVSDKKAPILHNTGTKNSPVKTPFCGRIQFDMVEVNNAPTGLGMIDILRKRQKYSKIQGEGSSRY